MAKTTDALTILAQMIGAAADMRQRLAEATRHAQMARRLYEARSAADFTQTGLAALVGTQPAGIARREEADDAGWSLALLHRLAATLGKELDMRLVPAQGKQQESVQTWWCVCP